MAIRRVSNILLTPEQKVQAAQVRSDVRWGVKQFDLKAEADAAAAAAARLLEMGSVAGMSCEDYARAKRIVKSRGSYRRR